MKEYYYVNNIKEFINGARAIVFNSFGKPQNDESDLDIMLSSVKPEEKEEFDKVLSYKESLVIVKQHLKKQRHKTNNTIRYCVNEKIFMKILESLNSRMVSNLLNKMTADGMIESAFDSELNDFVFWVKDNDDKKNKA